MTIRPVLFAFFILACLFFLSACFEELDDGYQWGDISHLAQRERAKLHQARVEYCSATQDSLTKKAALRVIQAKLPGYPDEGICKNLNTSNPDILSDDEKKQKQTDYDKIRGSPPDPGAR